MITGPILKGTLTTNPISEGIPKVEASSSSPIIKEKEKEKEEEIVEVSDSEDDFEVFNQPLSLDASLGDLGQSSPSPSQSSHHQGSTPIPDDIGIQRKQRSTLQELLESQLGRDASEKAAQIKVPIPPPTQPL